MRRLDVFSEGEIYHICNKSIANYNIFSGINNSQRFIETLDFYNAIKTDSKFSKALKNNKYIYQNLISKKDNSIIKFLAYCVMPDHYHLLLKILKNSCLSKYIGTVENSYSKYFNIKNNRKGPLWQSRFRSVRIVSNEQLLHVTRYLHLNPVTNNLVDKPENWPFSSYKDYLNKTILKEYLTEISISDPKSYKRFVESRIDYQKKLKLIKKLILE